MQSVEMAFERHRLKEVHIKVRDVFGIKSPMKAAWVQYWPEDEMGEFHGPGDFVWYGQVTSAYDARTQGWEEYGRHHGKLLFPDEPY